MQALIVAVIGKIVEVLINALFIPQIKAYRKRKATEKEDKRIAGENKKKGDAYAQSSAADAAADFRELP